MQQVLENDESIVDLIKFNDYLKYYTSDKKQVADAEMKMKTEAYYCVGGPIGKIRGTLTISNNLIYFEPNTNLMTNLNGQKIREFLEAEGVSLNVFQCSIDYTDIVSI